MAKGNFKHGYYGTPTYKSWSEMKYRCGNKKRKYWEKISFPKDWNVFESFLKDTGDRPANTSLDRINNNDNYSKSNCRWATSSTQNNNRRNSKQIIFNNKKMTLLQWSKYISIKRSTLAKRIYVYKWPLDKALKKGGVSI